MSSTQDLGLVTAYGYAVEGGYTGTEAEFKTLLGQQQTYHDEAVQAAEDAEAYAAQAMSGTPDGYASLVSTVNSLNSALINSTSYTPEFTWLSGGAPTVANISFKYAQIGGLLWVHGRFNITDLGTPTATNTSLKISLPSGYTPTGYAPATLGTYVDDTDTYNPWIVRVSGNGIQIAWKASGGWGYSHMTAGYGTIMAIIPIA